MRSKTHCEFLEELKIKNKLAYENLKFIGKYKTLKTKILAKGKYGLLLVRPDDLMSGSIPTINSAVNKTQYFINNAIKVHGDVYDYSLSKFHKHNSKVEILCQLHGVFEQTPYHHLNGHGCLLCGHKSSLGKYSPNNAEKYIKSWENIKAILYVIHFIENELDIYKIGITTNSIKERYRIEDKFKYKYNIELNFKTNLYDCCYLESKLHKKFYDKKYVPEFKFGGYTECFSNIDLKEVDKIVQNYKRKK